MSNKDYHEKFESLLSVYEGYGGDIGMKMDLIKEYLIRMSTTIANADTT